MCFVQQTEHFEKSWRHPFPSLSLEKKAFPLENMATISPASRDFESSSEALREIAKAWRYLGFAPLHVAGVALLLDDDVTPSFVVSIVVVGPRVLRNHLVPARHHTQDSPSIQKVTFRIFEARHMDK